MKNIIFMSGDRKAVFCRCSGIIIGMVIVYSASLELSTRYPTWIWVSICVTGGYITLFSLIALLRLLVFYNPLKQTICCGECSQFFNDRPVTDFRAILQIPGERVLLLEDYRFQLYWRLDFRSPQQANCRAQQLSAFTGLPVEELSGDMLNDSSSWQLMKDEMQVDDFFRGISVLVSKLRNAHECETAEAILRTLRLTATLPMLYLYLRDSQSSIADATVRSEFTALLDTLIPKTPPPEDNPIKTALYVAGQLPDISPKLTVHFAEAEVKIPELLKQKSVFLVGGTPEQRHELIGKITKQLSATYRIIQLSGIKGSISSYWNALRDDFPAIPECFDDEISDDVFHAVIKSYESVSGQVLVVMEEVFIDQSDEIQAEILSECYELALRGSAGKLRFLLSIPEKTNALSSEILCYPPNLDNEDLAKRIIVICDLVDAGTEEKR